MMIRRNSLVLVVIVIAGRASHAQPAPTADDYARLGKTAFDAGRIPEALEDYRTAYRMDPAPFRAVQVAITEPYAEDHLSNAFPSLQEWLLLKRRDARKAGDTEPSWDTVEILVKAFQACAQREEQIIIQQRTIVMEAREEASAERAILDELRKRVSTLQVQNAQLQVDLTNAKADLMRQRERGVDMRAP